MALNDYKETTFWWLSVNVWSLSLYSHFMYFSHISLMYVLNSRVAELTAVIINLLLSNVFPIIRHCGFCSWRYQATSLSAAIIKPQGEGEQIIECATEWMWACDSNMKAGRVPVSLVTANRRRGNQKWLFVFFGQHKCISHQTHPFVVWNNGE